MPMQVKFWGTRGSLPAPLTAGLVRDKIVRALQATHGLSLPSDPDELGAFVDANLPFSVRATAGGNTSCVQVKTGGPDYILLDAGTGIRDFAQDYRLAHTQGSRPSFPAGATFHLFLSHLHWDHLQGLPFFYPLYFADHRVIIYGGHEHIEHAVRQQFSAPNFPVPYEMLKAQIHYQQIAAGDVLEVAGVRVRVAAQNHPGGSFGYRFEQDGRIFVYSTDSEHKAPASLAPDYPLLSFFADADLLVFDAMYSLADASYNKAEWGHSSSVQGVELAASARVKRLALFHHDPHQDDADLEETLFNARMYVELYFQEKGRKHPGAHKYPTEVLLAYDGLTVEL
jgi:phosphoribosyl 1,2-cyclic phosphodiesterase